jgi:hypothetical protein
MRLVLTLLLVSIYVATTAQTKKWNIGTEQDVLPYVTGGYYGSVWVGKNHLRVRALTAKVNKPEFMVPDGFEKNTVTAYALLGEYFLKENWNGWSIAAGMVYWKSSIRRDDLGETAKYNNVLLNGSIAHTFRIYRNLYITPWAGMHLRVGGPQEVSIREKSFQTPLLNPEASVKVGVYL